jgi:AcrR family transcriptional regulator
MGTVEASRRRSQNRAEARRAILEATEALLVEEGYQGFSIRRLVDRCGYSAPSIYNYFGDKRGLIRDLVEDRFRRFVSDLESLPVGEDPIRNMFLLSRAFVEFGLRHSIHYWLLSTSLEAEIGEPPPAAEEARTILEGPLSELVSAGRLLADHETVKQATWALLHGLISLQTSRREIDWSENLFEVAFGAMMKGLVAPEEPEGMPDDESHDGPPQHESRANG